MDARKAAPPASPAPPLPPDEPDGPDGLDEGWSRPRLSAGGVLSFRVRRPVPASDYRHACRASAPGWLFWLLWAALAAAAVAFLLRGPLRWDWLPALRPSARALLAAATVLMLFWLVGWAWRRTPRGILLGLGERNVCSLSIGQAMAWTALLVAVTLVAVLSATGARGVDSLGTLQAGIGVGAAAGTGLALSGKARDALRPSPRDVARSARLAVARAPEPYVSDLVRGHATPGHPAAVLAQTVRAAATGATADAAKATRRAEAALSAIARGATPGKALAGLRLDDPAQRRSLEADLAGFRGHLEDAVRDSLATARSGVVYANGCPCEARLKDMLQGDETANAYHFDPNKLQFLALSLLGMVVYVAAMLHRLDEPFGLASDYPGGILAALGLSSASYVGFKLPVQTQTVA
jgi:hypothetical protein